MKKTFPLFATAFFALSTLFAQVPAIQWQRTIGGNMGDELSVVRVTPDGGYILGGTSASDSSGYKNEDKWGGNLDYWVVKLDSSGDIQWQRDFGGTFGGTSCTATLMSLELTPDGGYRVGGETDCGISGNKTEANKGYDDFWIIKLSAAGQTEWQKDIGGDSFEDLTSVQPTSDGGYIAGGNSSSGISGDKTDFGCNYGGDYWVVKLDMEGNIQWQNAIGGEQSDYLQSILQTIDGGYLLAGSSGSAIYCDKTEYSSLNDVDYWIVKLNATGTIDWQKTLSCGFPGCYFNHVWLQAARQTANGGYIIGGLTFNGYSDPYAATWVIKLDAIGTLQYQRLFPTAVWNFKNDILLTPDGGYVLACTNHYLEDSVNEYDYSVVKIDSLGQTLWQKVISGNKNDYCTSIQSTPDGGYVVGGYSDSDISGDKTENTIGNSGQSDYWIIKLSSGVVSGSEPGSMRQGLEIYPNPTAGAVFLRTEAPTHLSLYNALGQMILTQAAQDGEKIDLSTLPNGFYFLVETATGQAHKILKSK